MPVASHQSQICDAFLRHCRQSSAPIAMEKVWASWWGRTKQRVSSPFEINWPLILSAYCVLSSNLWILSCLLLSYPQHWSDTSTLNSVWAGAKEIHRMGAILNRGMVVIEGKKLKLSWRSPLQSLRNNPNTFTALLPWSIHWYTLCDSGGCNA